MTTNTTPAGSPAGLPDAAASPWREPFFWFLLATGTSFGIVNNFLPSVFPALIATFSATPEELGRAQMFFFGSGLAYSLVGGWIAGRIGLRRTLVAAVATIAGAWVIIATASDYRLVLVGATLSGTGSVAILVTSSAVIASCYPARRQSVFILFGLAGATGGSLWPAVTGKWLVFAEEAGVGWQLGVYVQIGLFAALAAWGAAVTPWSPRADMTGHGSSGGAGRAMVEVLRSREFYVASLWMFLHGLAQLGMISWIGQLYQARHSINAAQAAYFLTANAVGFFSGRMLLGWITSRRRIPELVVLTISGGGAAIMFAAAIAAPGYGWGLAAFLLAGVFTSGDAPSALSFVGARFTTHSATAFALLNGIGNIGAAGGPYFIGLMATFVDMETGVWAMPAFMAALALSAAGWHLVSRGVTDDGCQSGG